MRGHNLLSARRVLLRRHLRSLSFFFFNDTATTEIYTLSLHDALPICTPNTLFRRGLTKNSLLPGTEVVVDGYQAKEDRKSTRLNSSHQIISYAVFCLKKKKKRKRYRHC